MLEEMNALQVRKNLSRNTVAILVFGACENHGDHMPFGSDVLVPMELAKRVARKSRNKNIVILPALSYGVSLHHIDFQMTISLDYKTMISVIENLLTSLVKNNIKKILVINGHDGNIAPIEAAARAIKNQYPQVVIACLEAWWMLIGEITENLFDVWNGLGHGGEAETSAMLAVRPDLVDMSHAPKKIIPNLPHNIRIYWKFNELTKTGATGAPRKATIKKGQKALTVLEDILVSFLNDMDTHKWKYGWIDSY
jgi:creatinine amidohydrolase